MNEAININILSRNQKNEIWLSERNLRITASECYNLYTATKNINVEWDKKIDRYFKAKPVLKNLKIGRQEEHNAIKLYEIETKHTVTKFGLVLQPSCPWLGCSPDGFVLKSNIVVEVKTLMNESNENFQLALSRVVYLNQIQGKYFLKEKHKHYAQIQIYMHLLDSVQADLVIHNYRSKEILIITVEYNKTYVMELISTLKYVYFDRILPYVFENFTTLEDKKKYVL